MKNIVYESTRIDSLFPLYELARQVKLESSDEFEIPSSYEEFFIQWVKQLFGQEAIDDSPMNLSDLSYSELMQILQGFIQNTLTDPLGYLPLTRILFRTVYYKTSLRDRFHSFLDFENVLFQDAVDTHEISPTSSHSSFSKMSSPILSGDSFNMNDPKSRKKLLYCGIGTVAGAVAIGATAGLSAPIVLPALYGILGIGATASATSIGVFTAMFGVAGGGLTGFKVNRRFKEISQFEFLYLGPEIAAGLAPRLCYNATICIPGWITAEVDYIETWKRVHSTSSTSFEEIYVLKYESNAMRDVGKSLKRFIRNNAVSYAGFGALQMTALSTAAGAISWPITILSASSIIDNAWSIGLDRSKKAGIVLAHALLDRPQGARPVTLCGFSLGALVIYSCLSELSKIALGQEEKENDTISPYSLVENVFLLGLPATLPSKEHLYNLKLLVPGRFVHVYSEADWVLRFLFRAASAAQLKSSLLVAGNTAFHECYFIESVNMSSVITRHSQYQAKADEILSAIGFLQE